MMKAIVCERSQKRIGGLGPDRYVAVQIVPDGADPLVYLNHKVAALRGIEIIYCGEGYSMRQATERSMLNRARAKAREIAARYEDAHE